MDAFAGTSRLMIPTTSVWTTVGPLTKFWRMQV